jgi:DNA invertase Pin-like site-specific DNA recombinase
MSKKRRLIGYARVSTVQQDLTRQLKALKQHGCDLVFSDKASGKSLAGRPQLELAIDQLRKGDQLVLAEWDRATRSIWDGLHIIKSVIDAGATIRVLDRSYIDLDTPMGKGFMALFSAMAEDERERILKRTNEGRRQAMARGVKMGPRPKLNARQLAEIRERLANGESQVKLAESYGVHRSTISRSQS